MPNVLSHTTPEVFSPQSGRVDALRVAEYLHLRPNDIAAITGHTGRYVRKDPDAPSFQDPLKKVVFIVKGLLDLTGGDKQQALIWLNAPHPALDHAAPLDLMRGSELDVVVDLVDDMLTGAPA